MECTPRLQTREFGVLRFQLISFGGLVTMGCRWLALILFSSLALGQSPAPAQGGQGSSQTSNGAKSMPSPAAASSVPQDAPVITIDGLCSADSAGDAKSDPASPKQETTKSASGCKTVVTRERFERITDALNPNMKIRIKYAMAKAFPDALLFAQKAQELGLDKDPNFAELMKWKYLQAESQLFTKYLQDKSKNMSDGEVEKYYKDHPEMFEQLELVRIFIPKRKGEIPNPGTQPKVNLPEEAEMKAEAEKIQKRAAAGGDFGKLEDEVYKVVGVPNDAPSVNVGKMTRDQVPEQYLKVLFELQPGQVSQVVPGPQGWHIFKVVSKQMLSLKDARPIVERLQLKEWKDSLKGSIKAQFSDVYFAGADQPERNSDIDDVQ